MIAATFRLRKTLKSLAVTKEKQMYNVYNTSKELQEGNVETAILPIGSTEQHSQHLPLGTDWIIAKAISKRVAEKLTSKVYLLPGMPFGTSPCHSGFKGTVWIRPTTLFYFIKDTCLSLYNQGIKKIAIINAHGGNWIIKIAVRELNLDNPDINVIWCMPHILAQKRLSEVLESSDSLHAGEMETSCMMYLHSELVKKESTDYVPNVTQEFLDYLRMKDLSPKGVWGRPGLASKEKGEKAIKIMVEETVKYIRETFKKIEKIKRKR